MEFRPTNRRAVSALSLPAAAMGRRWAAVCFLLWAMPAAAGPSLADRRALGLVLSQTPATARLAKAAKPVAHRYGLKECLTLAQKNHPNIRMAQARLKKMRAQLREAHFAPFSNFSVLAGAGPAPTFRGGAVYTQSQDVGLGTNIGLGWSFEFNGTLPLWTFGKITNTWKAARAQIKVGKAQVNQQRNAVRMDVRKAYFGLQFARDTRYVLDEAKGRLGKAITKLQERIDNDDEDADEVDLIKLKAAAAELDARLAQANQYETIALKSLQFLTGRKDDFDIPDVPLAKPKSPLRARRTYLNKARRWRPEVAMARAGLAARTAQVDLARSNLMPDLGMNMFAQYSRAPEITDQVNPFVRDPANFFRFGFVLGFRWQLDLLPKAARVDQAKADLEVMRQTYRMATGGVSVEVETAYAEAKAAKKRVAAYEKAAKLAKRWLVMTSQGVDVGTMEEKEMIGPARMWAEQKFNYLNALHQYKIAMAKLAQKTGWDAGGAGE